METAALWDFGCGSFFFSWKEWGTRMRIKEMKAPQPESQKILQ